MRAYVVHQGLGEPGRAARRGYLEYACAQAEQAATHRVGPEHRLWYDRLEATYDNLRLAITDAVECAPQQALALAANLWPFWWERGYWQEGLRLLRVLLEKTRDEPPEKTVRAQLGAGALAYETGDFARAAQELTEAQRLALLAHDTWAQGEVLRLLGLLYLLQKS